VQREGLAAFVGTQRATHPRMVRGVRECVEFLRNASPPTPLN
jgi:hypothetical protein